MNIVVRLSSRVKSLLYGQILLKTAAEGFLNIRALSKFTPVYGRGLKDYTNSTLDWNKAQHPIRAHPSKTSWRFASRKHIHSG